MNTTDNSTDNSTDNQVSVEAVPDLPVIRMVREFEAPAAAVFRAHVERDLWARWIGPERLRTDIAEWSAETGGRYRYAMLEGDTPVAAFYGSFHEVRPSERIVQTFTWEGMPDGVSLDTATFADLPGGRCRLTTVSVVETLEARDAMLASGMETGVVEGYRKLDAVLAS